MKKYFKSSLAKRNLQKFLANKLAIIGLALIIIFVGLSLAAPLITSHDPNLVNPANRLKLPSSTHLLGTDNAGRDVLSRLLYGGRVSIFVGLVSALGASVIGIFMGCISGYFGGKIDATVLYITEIFTSFPRNILVLVMVGFSGRGLINLVFIFSITGWMAIARIVRSKIMSLRGEPFVESCRANGISGASIMFKHLLPNTLGPIIVSVTISIAGFVLQESALSFLGIGVPTGIATWGNVINAARSFNIFQNYPLLWIAPGLTISLFVLGINFFGDGLRDVFDVMQ